MTAPNTTSAVRVSIHGGRSKEFGDANDSTILTQTGFSTDWPLPRGTAGFFSRRSRSLDRRRQKSPVNADVCAGDEAAGRVRCEEHRCAD